MSQWNDPSNYTDDFQCDDSEYMHENESDQFYPEHNNQESVVEPCRVLYLRICQTNSSRENFGCSCTS